MRAQMRHGGVRVAIDPPAPIATTFLITSDAPINFAPGDAPYQITVALFDALSQTITGRAVTYLSSAPGVATVHASNGLVTPVGGGSTTITATSEGLSDSQSVVTVSAPQNAVNNIVVSPTALGLTTGQTSVMGATVRDVGGSSLPGKIPTWNSDAPSKATVTSPGLTTTVSGIAAGTSNVRASCDGVDSSPVVVTVSNPPGGSGNPTPSGTIYLDARSGGANSLQAATTLAQAFTAWSVGTPASFFSQNIGFTTNVDGSGTHALLVMLGSWNGTPGDGGGNMQWYMPNGTKPTELYVQWKHRMGRTATGGGNGSIGVFDITNENDPGGNAGRKYLLMLRDVADGGSGGRIDHVWAGPSPVSVHTEGWYGLVPHPGNQGLNIAPFDPEAHLNENITFTHYVKCASAPGASDGIVRVWYNGVLCADHTGLPNGNLGIHRFQFPSTFRSPKQDQTEYFWDMVVWKP